MTAPTLFDPLRVHCIFCDHVAESFTGDPHALHDEMELHYAGRHRLDVERAVGRVLVGTITVGAEWGED